MQHADAPRNDAHTGPGGQLRAARLELKLAPEDVAQILHLSPKQIVALESDDYAHLPGPTYVRGYLRGYAQLLGLSPDVVIDAYNRIPAAKPQVDLTKLSPEPQISSDHHMMRFTTFAVVAIVFGLTLAWWLGRDDTRRAPAQEATETAVLSPTTASQVAEGQPGAEQKAPVTPPVPVPATNPQPSAAPSAPVTVLSPTTKPQILATPPTSSTFKPLAMPATPAPVASGPRTRVVLSASQDAWVDIRDAQQNKLIYETLRPGQTVSLEGLAPLAVFLGNADGVKIEHDGKPFDIAPFKRGLVARFSLSAPAPEPGNGQR